MREPVVVRKGWYTLGLPAARRAALKTGRHKTGPYMASDESATRWRYAAAASSASRRTVSAMFSGTCWYREKVIVKLARPWVIDRSSVA